MDRMSLEFSGEIWQWRGPAPFYFVTVPEGQSRDIKSAQRFVSYGWGMIPVKVQIGKTQWKTSLWPKDGLYVVPLKANIRKAESLEEGQTVTVKLELG